MGDLPQFWAGGDLHDFFASDFGEVLEARVIGSQVGGGRGGGGQSGAPCCATVSVSIRRCGGGRQGGREAGALWFGTSAALRKHARKHSGVRGVECGQLVPSV